MDVCIVYVYKSKQKLFFSSSNFNILIIYFNYLLLILNFNSIITLHFEIAVIENYSQLFVEMLIILKLKLFCNIKL